MKKTRLAILGSMTAFASHSVFAAADPHAVVSAIQQGQWGKADALIQQVLKEQPGSAKAWYYRAQIETQLAKNSPYHSAQEMGYINSALNSLNQASSIDSSLSFASPAHFQELKSTLLSAQAKAQTGHSVVHSSNTVVPVSNSPMGAKETHHSGFGVLGFSLVAIGVICAAGFMFVKRKEKNTLQKEVYEVKSKMTALSDSIENYKKDLTFQGKETTLQYSQANSLWNEIVDKISEVYDVNKLQSYKIFYNQCETRFKQIKNGDYNTIKERQLEQEQKEYSRSRYQSDNPEYSRSRPRSEEPEYYSRNHSQQPQQAPTTIINNNDSGSGGFGSMLTGVMIGEMIGGGHEREHDTTIIEREVVREPEPAPYFDEGNNDDSWDSEPKDSGFDFGTGFDSSSDFDNNDDTSFDSGSSDDDW